MKPSALARSSTRSTLKGATTTGWPARPAASLPSVGISLTHGAHQVAQRLSTTTLPLKSPSVWVLPAASVKGVAGAGAGWSKTTSDCIGPVASCFSAPPGLEEQPAMTYRAAATPIRAKLLSAQPSSHLTFHVLQVERRRGPLLMGRAVLRQAGRADAGHQRLHRFRQAPG